MCPQWTRLSDSRPYSDRDMFVTVRVQATTLRGVRSTALAVVFAVLSFFALSALCSAEDHASATASHEHTTDSAHSRSHAHAAEHAPSDHCHHDREPVHRKAALDRVLHRPDDTAWDAQSSSHDVPASLGYEISTVPSGLGTAFWARTSGPPRPGRQLLVLLSVARN
jgi:hypothetical protein